MKKAVLIIMVAGVGCGSSTVKWVSYRLDDHFGTAKITASDVPSSATTAKPIKWDFSERKLDWTRVRGRVGFRPGSLVLMGQGSTPLIVSPERPAIDWSQYEKVLIRMLSEGGNEIKIRLGDWEQKQKLGPPNQFQVYEFELNREAPSYLHQLALIPTDSVDQPVEIDYIDLVPRKMNFPEPAGRDLIGKSGAYRDVLYAHAPSSFAYQVTVPESAKLRCGLGVVEENRPVRFQVRVGRWGIKRELYSTILSDPSAWQDMEVDLSAYQGKTVQLVLQTDAEEKGRIGLWANPLLTTTAKKSRPNVLLYVIDTLRADRTSLYGYRRNTTPFLKKLGATGVVFDDCHAQATWTKPSVASLMTSLYSVVHGIVEYTDGIPKGSATIAEAMRKAGYITASIVSSPFAGRNTSLQRGFDYLMEHPVIDRETLESDGATDSAALNRVAFPWLERHYREPFFLYLHSTDPHAPYHPPAPYEALFANPAETAAFERDNEKLRELRHYVGGSGFNRAECLKNGIDPDRHVKRALDRYDGEVAHNDKNIELLVEKLRSLGVLENTLLTIVSDHGEEFLEHGWTSHGQSLYQELTHVVFLMWSPALFPVPRRVVEPVQLIDIAPTLLDLLHVESDGIMQGQSVLPLAQGLPFRRRNPVMTSRLPQPGKSAAPVPENLTRTFAWLDPAWKLIYRDQAEQAGLNRVELYSRRTDPTDKKNVAAQDPDIVKGLNVEVLRWIETQESIRKFLGPGPKSTIDPQLWEELRSLGYVDGKSGKK